MLEADHFNIATSRLLLQPLTQDDARDWWQAIWSDPNVTQYLPPKKPLTQDQVSERLERVRQHWRIHGLGIWAVRANNQGLMVGHCGFVLNEPPDVELVYAVAHSAWGRGFATEAARAVVEFAFDRGGLDQIFALLESENLASARILDKLGFVLNDHTTREGIPLLRYVLRK